MKNLKKLAVIVLSGIMLMCGCTGKNKAVNREVSTGNSVITEKPTELTVFYPSSKEDDGQWKIFEEAGKMTNVYAKTTISKSNTDFSQAFNLMLASGNMPDIVVTYDPVTLSEYGADGAFVKLNEYIDKYAPNIKKFLDENPEIKRRITSYDKNIYYIPHIPGGSVSTGWFVREDWLKKLNMSVPTNVDELYTVLKAFKNNDPNENGKADEIPYFSNTSKVDCLYPLWGARPDWYVKDGKVKYGPYETEYKTAIQNISNWYAEGLIDAEIYTRGNNAREKLFSENVGGITHDWFGSTAAFNTSLSGKVQNFKIKAFAPPSGVELESRPISSPCGWAISSSCKNIETAVKYFDFWFSKEGSRLMNFGVEGVHYDLVDDKPVFKKELLNQSDFKKQLTSFGVQMDIGFVQDFEYEKQWINESAVEGMKLYEEGNFVEEQFPMISMEYSSDEMKEYSNLQTQIDTYVSEMEQKWILGANDVNSTYDGYIQKLEKFGINRLIELQQKAYDRYASK